MAKSEFRPGFRLSRSDVGVLIGGAVLAGAVSVVDGWIGLATAFVVAHFFLFCNILRMPRPLELVWTAIFAMLAIAAEALEAISWPMALGLSCIATMILTIIQARRPSYHGVRWERINPGLPGWWESHDRAGE